MGCVVQANVLPHTCSPPALAAVEATTDGYTNVRTQTLLSFRRLDADEMSMHCARLPVGQPFQAVALGSLKCEGRSLKEAKK